nr:M48 family metallopeptidase [Noviherbaspirillum humi]
MELSVQRGVAYVRGIDSALMLVQPIRELRVSSKLGGAPRKVTFPDGAFLEIRDDAAFEDLLRSTGHAKMLTERLEQSWHGALIAVVLVLLGLVFGYQVLLPAGAKLIAGMTPISLERRIGKESFRMLDDQLFKASSVPKERQEAILKRFAALLRPHQEGDTPRLHFRSGPVGPNAFALPSGDIVLTDELVKLAADDDAIVGVLAHELGHLDQRHFMRRLIQTSVVGAGMSLLFGDVSTIVASVPAMLLDLHYSRDAEREADDYALAMMKSNGVPAASLVRLLESIKPKDDGPVAYLSTHPATSERIARIRQVM